MNGEYVHVLKNKRCYVLSEENEKRNGEQGQERFKEDTDSTVKNVAGNVTDISDTSLSDKLFPRKLTDLHIEKKAAIVLFPRKHESLYRMDYRGKSLIPMQKYRREIGESHFTASSFGEYIYVFARRHSVYRVKHSKVKASWERMSDWIGDHGGWGPNVVASPNAIFLVGGPEGRGRAATTAVTKFIPLMDHWHSLKDKPTATGGSALVCNNDFLYSVGGIDKSGNPSKIVERMDLMTMTWRSIASMNHSRTHCSASECAGNIYVVDTFSGDLRTEMYDPNVNQWNEIKSFNILPDRTHCRRLFGIGSSLTAITAWSAATYNIDNGEWSVFKLTDMSVAEAVMVQM